MSLVILHHLVYVSVQLAKKKGIQTKKKVNLGFSTVASFSLGFISKSWTQLPFISSPAQDLFNDSLS
jgi:hypothetical protein